MEFISHHFVCYCLLLANLLIAQKGGGRSKEHLREREWGLCHPHLDGLHVESNQPTKASSTQGVNRSEPLFLMVIPIKQPSDNEASFTRARNACTHVHLGTDSARPKRNIFRWLKKKPREVGDEWKLAGNWTESSSKRERHRILLHSFPIFIAEYLPIHVRWRCQYASRKGGRSIALPLIRLAFYASASAQRHCFLSHAVHDDILKVLCRKLETSLKRLTYSMRARREGNQYLHSDLFRAIY